MPPRGRQPKGTAPTKVRPDHRASSRGPTERSPAGVQLRPRSVLSSATPAPRPLSVPIRVARPASPPPPSSSSSSSSSSRSRSRPRSRSSLAPSAKRSSNASFESEHKLDRDDFTSPQHPDVFIPMTSPDNPFYSPEPEDFPEQRRPRTRSGIEYVVVEPGSRVREIAEKHRKKSGMMQRSRAGTRGQGWLVLLSRFNRLMEPVCEAIATVTKPLVLAPIVLYLLIWIWLLAQEVSIFGVGTTVERIGAAMCETRIGEVLPTTYRASIPARPTFFPGLNTTDVFGAAARKELLMSFTGLELDSDILGTMEPDVQSLTTSAAASRTLTAFNSLESSHAFARESLRAWLHSPPSRELSRLWKGWSAQSIRAGEKGRHAAAGFHYVFPPALSAAPSGFMLLQLLPVLKRELRGFVWPLETRLQSAIGAAEALIGQTDMIAGVDASVAEDVGARAGQVTRSLGVALGSVRGLAGTLQERVADLEKAARCPHLVNLPELDWVFGGAFVDVVKVLTLQESMAAEMNAPAKTGV